MYGWVDGWVGKRALDRLRVLIGFQWTLLAWFLVSLLWKTILKCSQDNAGYLLCPHTAVAVKYFYELEVETDVAYVCIATASPAKFPEAIAKSGLQPYNPPEIQALFELEEKFETMDQGQDWELMLREKIVQVST